MLVREPFVPMLRRARMSLAALALATLGACGPGLGGTGSGEGATAMDALGAEPAAVCASELATALGCPGATSAAPAQERWFTHASARAHFTGNEVSLSWPCEGVEFAGSWGRAAGQAPRYFGLARLPGTAGELLATAQVEVAPNGALAFSLRDAAGHLLLAPVTLAPVSGTPGAATCPG